MSGAAVPGSRQDGKPEIAQAEGGSSDCLHFGWAHFVCLVRPAALCRAQVKKDEKELNVAWGAGPAFSLSKKGPQTTEGGKEVGARTARGLACAATGQAQAATVRHTTYLLVPQPCRLPHLPSFLPCPAHLPAHPPSRPPQIKMATVQLFGSDEQCAAAVAMINEAVDNKEQKSKQRQKEYDKKKEVGLGAGGWAALLCCRLPACCLPSAGAASPAPCSAAPAAHVGRPPARCACPHAGQAAGAPAVPHAPRPRLRGAGPAAGRLQGRRQGRLPQAGAQVAPRQEPGWVGGCVCVGGVGRGKGPREGPRSRRCDWLGSLCKHLLARLPALCSPLPIPPLT